MRPRVHRSRPSVGAEPSRASDASASQQAPPAWDEFDELPTTDVEPQSPAGELAALLQRFRDDLDAAARAGAESRRQGLRALAEQAVLAVELDKLLERHAAQLHAELPESAHAAFGALKDRMLAHAAACGLEVVRLDGARARDVADVVDVECWRYDERNETPIVVQEIEAAIRLDGEVFRRGRVVIGGQLEAPPPEPPALQPSRDRTAPGDTLDGSSTRPCAPGIVCPIAGCGAVNDVGVQACIGCLTPLDGFARMSRHADALIARGLRAARAGDCAHARECFAAVILWHPHESRTRNAYALACFDGGDADAARRAWEEVLACSPGDSFAVRGLAAVSRTPI